MSKTVKLDKLNAPIISKTPAADIFATGGESYVLTLDCSKCKCDMAKVLHNIYKREPMIANMAFDGRTLVIGYSDQRAYLEELYDTFAPFLMLGARYVIHVLSPDDTAMLRQVVLRNQYHN